LAQRYRPSLEFKRCPVRIKAGTQTAMPQFLAVFVYLLIQKYAKCLDEAKTDGSFPPPSPLHTPVTGSHSLCTFIVIKQATRQEFLACSRHNNSRNKQNDTIVSSLFIGMCSRYIFNPSGPSSGDHTGGLHGGILCDEYSNFMKTVVFWDVRPFGFRNDDVSEESLGSIIGELGTTLAVTSN
jgi:hypothetical protein